MDNFTQNHSFFLVKYCGEYHRFDQLKHMQIVSRVSDNPHAKFGDNRSKTAKKNAFFQFLSDRSVGLVCIFKKISTAGFGNTISG